MLSVPLIVKNEADTLAACLASVRDVADELLVLDTGSTDATVKIANEYADWVGTSQYFKADTPPETFDFAVARNEVLDRCTYDQILSIDADERLVESSALRQWLFRHRPDCANIMLRHEPDSGHRAWVPRMFNRTGRRWEGRYHDKPKPWSNAEYVPETITYIVNTRLPSIEDRRRNLVLLKKQSAEEGRVTGTFIEIADTYRGMGIAYLAESLGYYHALDMATSDRVTPECAYLWYCIADSYSRLGMSDPALRYARRILALWPQYVYAHQVIGDTYRRCGEFELASIHYRKILGETEPMPLHQYVNLLIDRDDIQRHIEECEKEKPYVT